MELELEVEARTLSAGKLRTRRDSVPDSDACFKLSTLTKNIKAHPYDPVGWLARALVFEQLGYSELVVGDAYKAQMLCQAHEEALARSKCTMGHRMGFAVIAEHDRIGDVVCMLEQRERLTEILRGHRLLISRLCDRQVTYTPQLYPWLRPEHRCRSDAQLDAWNAELLTKVSVKSQEPCCIVRRNAFGSGIGPAKGAELFGVCATRSITKGQIIITDPAKYWVGALRSSRVSTSADNRQGHNNSGATRTSISPGRKQRAQSDNRRHDTENHHFDWIRAEAGIHAADVILRARILEDCQESGVKHPLDQPIVARLIACYRTHDRRDIDAEIHFGILNKVLQKQLRVNIFADHRYDTWVLYTIMARVDNNAWTDPGLASLNILFCAFNHSCEPNLDWHIDATDGRCTAVKLTAKRDIKAGEQLFVIYDQYLIGAPLMDRRAAMRRWLDADCQCVRCAREEAARVGGANGTSLTDRYEWQAEDSRLLEAKSTHDIQETCVSGPMDVYSKEDDQIVW